MEPFPCEHQISPMDCGPACLKNITAYYGRQYSLDHIGQLCGLTPQGVSLAGMIQGAETLGFSALPIQCTMEQLVSEVPLPAIIHWRQHHFVVIYQVTPSAPEDGDHLIYLSDPARGLVNYPVKFFQQQWLSPHTKPGTGAVLLIEPKFRVRNLIPG